MNQETRWNTRYRDAGDDYLFGTESNRFLVHRAALLRNGRTVVSVADGEGRNPPAYLATARFSASLAVASASTFGRCGPASGPCDRRPD